MGWNSVLKPDKGLLMGKNFIYEDISQSLKFSNYTDNYDIIALTGTGDFVTADGFIGYHIENLNYFITEHGLGEHLLAAWNVSPQGGESGAYLCLVIDLSNYVVTETNTSVRVQMKVTKRLYDYAGTHYTESFPLGTYFQSHDLTLRNTNGSDDQQGTGIIVFFKYATYNSEKNYCVGYAHLMKSGFCECYGSGMGYRIKETYFKSSDGWGSNAAPQESAGDSEEFGTSSYPKGGYNEDATHGSFDDTSDKITVSSKPSLSVGNSGFVHAYYVTESILQSIGTALFPSIESQSFTGIPEALDYLTMVMFYNKRTDYILDVLILPFEVPHSSNASRVRVGGSELVVQEGGEQVYCQAYPVTDYYVDIDCGNLAISEYWANFLDFSGTRFKIFLPAVGYVDLQNEFINGGEINVKYRFNIVDGSFMCFITATSGHSNLEQSLVAQYSGVWCMHIPITGQDYTNKISGLISSVGSVAAGGLLGGGGAFMGAVNSLANTAMQKPQMTHANGYNASSSFLTHRKPYLIIERQSSQFSELYPSETGLPCYVTRKLSNLRGFTVIENPVLNIACSDAEYNELVQLLKSGVIL